MLNKILVFIEVHTLNSVLIRHSQRNSSLVYSTRISVSSKGLLWTSDKSCSLLKAVSPRYVCMKWVTADCQLSPGCFLFAVLYILEKESKDFASCVFPSGLFVVHDASWGGQHNVSAETRQSVTIQLRCIHHTPSAQGQTGGGRHVIQHLLHRSYKYSL